MTTEESGQFCPACGGALRAAAATAPRVSAAHTRPEGAAAVAAARITPVEPEVASPAPDASLIGETVDGFRIEGVLGEGSFGTVYRARQLGLDRPVALKVPTAEIYRDPVTAKRFAREARAASRITHPGVVAIYAVGELADRRPYLAMQLVEGEPLDRILGKEPLPVTRALRIARDVASALSETHAADVVHRDLKPSNIVWRRDRNGDDRITIVDFGIAVARPGNADATRLTTNGVIGTPNYMSPEQAQGEQVDARSDLYALGCVLYELLTGSPPFEGSGFEVLLAHMGRPTPPPSSRRADLSVEVDDLVLHLLAKRPDARPQTAQEVVSAIDDTLAAIEPRGPRRRRTTRTSRERSKRRSAIEDVLEASPDPLAPAPARRSRARLIGAAALLVAGAAGVTAFALRSSSRAPTRPPVTSTTTDPDDAPAPSAFTGRREVISDDGEMTTRATLYDPIVAGTRVRTAFEVWNGLGHPFDVAHLIVTIEGPTGEATGVTAPRSRRAAGRFAFWYVFPSPGRYVLRVFPPEAASVFTIEIDVEAS